MRTKITTVTTAAPKGDDVDLGLFTDKELKLAQVTMRTRRQGYLDTSHGRITTVEVRKELDARKEAADLEFGPLTKTQEAFVYGYWDETTAGTEYPLALDDRPAVKCRACAAEIATGADHRIGYDHRGKLVDLHRTCSL